MKNYYLVNNGRLRRDSNSLVMEATDGLKRQIPVEDVDSILIYGEVDFNSKALTFLASKRIPLHVFNYYGFYSGSYYPREYLHSGHLLVHQVSHYSDMSRRLVLVRELVRASAHSMLRNVAYYANRRKADTEEELGGEIGGESGKEVATEAQVDALGTSDTVSAASGAVEFDIASDIADIDPFATSIQFEEELAPLVQIRGTIQNLATKIDDAQQVDHLRGLEGKMRERYYQAWRHILGAEWTFERRVRRPPDNEVNALISFGNSMLYTICLSEIYRTQLTPTISYLHEPGARRFSLALDISEIFKPLLVDRTIFRLLNRGQLKPEHFDHAMECCYLNEAGKKLFLMALEDRLNTTIKHRVLGRHVSYRHLIRLECYKLIRHLTGVDTYHAFRAWW